VSEVLTVHLANDREAHRLFVARRIGPPLHTYGDAPFQDCPVRIEDVSLDRRPFTRVVVEGLMVHFAGSLDELVAKRAAFWLLGSGGGE